MGMLFIKDGLVDPAMVSVDSSLLKAKGHVWHRSNMKNEVPRSGMDTDARWGFSRTKGWVFGYKMHLASSTGSLMVPLSADFTTANITDNRMYESMTSPLPTGMVMYVVGDEGYDDHKLCDFSRYRGYPVFPLERYKHTTDNNRLALLQFYNSGYGQHVYSRKSIRGAIDRAYEGCIYHRSIAS